MPGCDGLYQASSLGRIRSSRPRRGSSGRPLRAARQPRGYLTVVIWTAGSPRSRTVHRIIAEAFLGPGDGLQVNHKNGDKTDNRVENLEWVTQGENLRHAYATGLRKPRVLTSEQARAAGRKGGVASGIARRAVSL